MSDFYLNNNKISNNKNLGIISGRILKSHPLIEIAAKLRTKSSFERNIPNDSEILMCNNDVENPILGKITKEQRTEDLNNSIELVRDFLLEYKLTFTELNAIETTYLIAPAKHNIDDIHSDGTEYGKGITFIIYPRTDNNIINGGLNIFDLESGEYINYRTRKIKSPKPIFRIESKCEDDNYVNFVIMDGSVNHQVESIDGTGVREAVIWFLSIN